MKQSDVAMDSRLAERRKGVSEDNARRRLRWVLIILGVVLAAAGTAWLIQSPVLSIRTVEVTGAVQSQPAAIVERLEFGVGTPTIRVDGGVIRAAVVADPWVNDARVSVIWPGRIAIEVIEHEPVTIAQRGDEWFAISIDGTIVEKVDSPDSQDHGVAIDVGEIQVGEATTDRNVVGAVAFIQALPEDLRSGTVVTYDGTGLHTKVAGHDVILGGAREMSMKAAVLVALIADGLESGASVNLLSPTRPAVTNPEPQPEPEG